MHLYTHSSYQAIYSLCLCSGEEEEAFRSFAPPKESFSLVSHWYQAHGRQLHDISLSSTRYDHILDQGEIAGLIRIQNPPLFPSFLGRVAGPPFLGSYPLSSHQAFISVPPCFLYFLLPSDGDGARCFHHPPLLGRCCARPNAISRQRDLDDVSLPEVSLTLLFFPNHR